MNKGQLAVTLSKLKTLEKPKVKYEQYQTDPEIAAEIVWFAFMNGDIKNKIVADFGSGNGVLGIAALLLGAKQVYFIDIDRDSILLTKQNLNSLNLKNYILLHQDISEFNKKIDTVLENPPFGVQAPYADKPFLIKAMQLSNTIYSFHKIESKQFIEALASDHNFKINFILPLKLKIKKTQKFHKKQSHLVNVGIWKLKRNI